VPVLVRDEALIRRRLSTCPGLVIDIDTQVAFTRQADAGDWRRRAPPASAVDILDSIMLLHLRQRLTEADAQGERR